MNNSKIKVLLLNLNFSSNDVDVYLSLINNQPCTSGPIISDTGLHRNIVYTSLEHLTIKKIITTSLKNGKNLYTANNPKIINDIYRSKSQSAKKAVSQLTNLIKYPLQEITIHRDNNEYLNLLINLIESMPKNSTKYVIGTGDKNFMNETMLPIWKKYHKIAENKLKEIKMIAYDYQKKDLEPYLSKKKIYNVKYIKSDSENPSGIHIYPEIDTILTIIYSDKNKPVTAIKIVDKSLVDGYMNLFKQLWNK